MSLHQLVPWVEDTTMSAYQGSNFPAAMPLLIAKVWRSQPLVRTPAHAALRATRIARSLSARNARPTMAPRSVGRRMSQIVGSSGVALSASSRSGFGRRLPARPTARAVPHSRNKGSHSHACPIIPGRS